MATTKTISLEEIQQHKSRDSLWLLIHNKIYDVTKFMDEHPGGEEVMLEQAGKDATEMFDDVSHSADAHDLMKNYLIGELPDNEKASKPEKKTITKRIDAKRHFDDSDHSLSLTWPQWIITAAVSIGVGLVVRNWFS